MIVHKGYSVLICGTDGIVGAIVKKIGVFVAYCIHDTLCGCFTKDGVKYCYLSVVKGKCDGRLFVSFVVLVNISIALS